MEDLKDLTTEAAEAREQLINATTSLSTSPSLPLASIFSPVAESYSNLADKVERKLKEMKMMVVDMKAVEERIAMKNRELEARERLCKDKERQVARREKELEGKVKKNGDMELQSEHSNRSIEISAEIDSVLLAKAKKADVEVCICVEGEGKQDVKREQRVLIRVWAPLHELRELIKEHFSFDFEFLKYSGSRLKVISEKREKSTIVQDIIDSSSTIKIQKKDNPKLSPHLYMPPLLI